MVKIWIWSSSLLFTMLNRKKWIPIEQHCRRCFNLFPKVLHWRILLHAIEPRSIFGGVEGIEQDLTMQEEWPKFYARMYLEVGKAGKAFLIHSADPQSWPVEIIVFPLFINLAKQNNFQVRIVIATGGTVGLAEWIIDGTHVLSPIFQTGQSKKPVMP